VLWHDETFRDWTSEFAQDSAGSRLVSDWEEGSRFEYFEGDAGSYGVIETLVPAEQAVFRHLGDIDSGEDRPSNEGDTLSRSTGWSKPATSRHCDCPKPPRRPNTGTRSKQPSPERSSA
jgi:hypothetical protein